VIINLDGDAGAHSSAALVTALAANSPNPLPIPRIGEEKMMTESSK
jgi:hypothetical protein